MNKTEQVYLLDIQQAILQIEEYTDNVKFDQFIQDKMRQDAVVQQLEIIGEASRRLSSSFLDKLPIREAVDMRNFLIHNYDELNLETIWKTINTDLLELKAQLKVHINNQD